MLNDKFFLDIASRVAEESHCVSLHVGAVIVKDQRIISIGYNGTPAGVINCDDALSQGLFERDNHHEWSLKNEIHAEMNALMFAAKNGIPVNGCTLYVTHQPCDDCMKNISQSGIVRVVYLNKYNKTSEDSLTRDGVIVSQYHEPEEKSNFVVDYEGTGTVSATINNDIDTDTDSEISSKLEELKIAYRSYKALGNGMMCQHIQRKITQIISSLKS